MIFESKKRLAAFTEWWANNDLDPDAARELKILLDTQPESVIEMFSKRINFGTAGLRARIGPGPQQMNTMVVRQTTQGLISWLEANPARGSEKLRIIVGRDARHKSAQFAKAVAEIVVASGHVAKFIEMPVPTPVLAHAVLTFEADAGVMITASHNPAADNGYKLYLSDGLQLVSPADTEIAAEIMRLVLRDFEANITYKPIEQLEATSGFNKVGSEVLQHHSAASIECLRTKQRKVSILYTPLHGVAGEHLLNCFTAAGFEKPSIVAEQFVPDPEFPTATSPNPEDAATLKLGIAALLEQPKLFDMLLANDPDGDRLAVVVPDGSGVYKLSGDEIGVLLADHVFRNTNYVQDRNPESGEAASGKVNSGEVDGVGVNGFGDEDQTFDDALADSGLGSGDCLVASSIVSSRWIETIAASYGIESVRTLTGFKWVARPIVDRPEKRYLFGYEEALGFCIDDRVRDKDGISAALVMAELAAELKASGETVLDRLKQLELDHGLYLTSQRLIKLDSGPQEIAELLRQLSPKTLGGVAVAAIEDLSLGKVLPPTVGYIFDLVDGSRVIVRPSGTEPKVKIYVEVVTSASSIKGLYELDALREISTATLEKVAEEAEMLVRRCLEAS